MDSYFSQPFRAVISLCDSSMKMNVHHAFSVFENVASEHGLLLGITGEEMLRRSNAFWVMSRARIRFLQHPEMMEMLEADTWAAYPEKMRCDRYYSIRRGEEELVQARFHWAIIDATTGATRSMDSIHLDWNAMTYRDRRVCDEPFTHFTDDFTQAELVDTVPVKASDIDFVHHMNNVAYIRVLMDTFTAEEQEKTPAAEMEVNFCGSALSGETLSVFRRKTDAGWDFSIRRPNGKTAVLARLIPRRG